MKLLIHHIEKILLTLVILGTPGVAIMAQKRSFSIFAAPGLSTLNYRATAGTRDRDAGFHGGIGYSVRLRGDLSLQTGVELATYTATVALPGVVEYRSNEVDDEFQGFELRSTVTDYREQQSILALGVPVSLRWETQRHALRGFYVQAGAKVSVPVKATYQATATDIQTSGFYPDLNAVIDDAPSHGFGRWGGREQTGQLELNPAVSAIAEAGLRLRIIGGPKLYIGLFGEYGLNDARSKKGNSSVIGYNPQGGTDPAGNSYTSLSDAGKLTLLAAGLKLRWSLGIR